jgi:hypothetical protein
LFVHLSEGIGLSLSSTNPWERFGVLWIALNADPFLDLAGYLKTLPPSDDPQKVFNALYEPAAKLVKAQNVIDQMLKQQAGKR